jgi:hypothetical protein
MSDHPAIVELCERIEWISNLIAMRGAGNDADRASALTRVIEAHANLMDEAGGSTPRTDLLRTRLALSETELQVVWLLAAAALDERTKQLIAIHGGVGPVCGLDAIRRLIYGARPSELALHELGPTGCLRLLGLIERADGQSDTPESRWSWALSSRMLAWLHGNEAIDSALRSIVRVADDPPPVSFLAMGEGAINEARTALRNRGITLVASGKPALGRRTLLAALAHEAGLRPAFIDCERLQREPAALALQLRAIARECRLFALVPLLANIDTLVDEATKRIDLVGDELVAHVDGLVLATCGLQRPALRWNRPVVVVEVEPPSFNQRATLWRRALVNTSAEDARVLANLYPLAPALVEGAARAALAHAGNGDVGREDVAAGVRSVLDDRLGHLARRVTTPQTWDDVVLPDDQRDEIIDLLGRIRERTRVFEEWGYGNKLAKGLGTCALFSGPPGTGKTMVAALIAKDLGLELYQVDLARVVSKWIGESEKNLATLFDGAEAGHAILLFDEADSLFGKRTEVRSSNDRYANLETNYLLQRIESFTGICLLTSNHETNIDPAFQRRMSLHVRFELPDETERARLWRALIPKEAPVAREIDFRRLARNYEMAGGAIRNASLRAAFMAAERQTPIGMEHLERAARLEYEALGKIAGGTSF